jgi:hypothetical protein
MFEVVRNFGGSLTSDWYLGCCVTYASCYIGSWGVKYYHAITCTCSTIIMENVMQIYCWLYSVSWILWIASLIRSCMSTADLCTLQCSLCVFPSFGYNIKIAVNPVPSVFTAYLFPGSFGLDEISIWIHIGYALDHTILLGDARWKRNTIYKWPLQKWRHQICWIIIL